MKLNRNNESKEQFKLGKKDGIIVALSVLLLMLLFLIVFLSRKRDQMIADSLQKNSEMSTDAAIANNNSISVDYLSISEISADKWIEIQNTGTDTVDLSGLQIKVSNDVDVTIEEGTHIDKGEYYVVELHSNPGKEAANVITICDSDGVAIKSILVPRLGEGISYGLADSESNIWGYIDESKGKENFSKNVEYIKEGGIGFSAPGGFYSGSFGLVLDCPEGEKIYYTTDGTRPTTESIPYENGIIITNKSGSNYVYANEATFNRLSSNYMPGSVDMGMIVRAIRVDSAGNTVGEMNQAYYVGLSKDSDYLNLPVISIITDPENLFDYEHGIYIAGKQREDARIQGLRPEYYANYYNPWKKPAIVEYYEPTKDKTFEMEATININNDMHIASRQKGLVIGIEDKPYSDYEGSSITDFISSEGNIRLTTNFNDNDLKIRNKLADSLIEGTEIAGTGCEPCVVFLDGEYWGLYVIRPYYDAKYIENKYGIKEKDIVFHSGNEYNQSFASFYNYATQTDLSLDENYEQIKTMMDIDNFIDYVCFNIYLGNSSFYPQNGTAWRTETADGTGMADGRWRFICGDLSNTMYLSADQTPTMDTYLQTWVQGDMLLQSLLMNSEFCDQLNKRMKEMATDIFDAEKCTEKVDAAAALLKKPAMASYTRFNGNFSDTTYSLYTSNIKAYFEERSEYILKYTEKLANKGGNLQKAREIQAEAKSAAEDEIEGEAEGISAEGETIEGETVDLENAQENGQNNNLQNDNSEGNTNG